MPARTTTTVPGASPEAADEQPSPSASGRRLTLLYIFALSTVAVLSVGAQLLIQRQLHTGEGDSRVINFAGRQRMLSQRLAKSALRLKSVDADGRTESLAELKETVDLWTRTHDGLLQGDAELRLPGGNSPAVTELFAVIEPDYLAMAAAARTLLTGDAGSPPDREAIATIQRHENRFLTGMDEIVSQYVLEAEHRVERLSRLELAILALTLLVLLAEGVLIFRPAVRRIEQAVSRLETVSDRLRRAKDEAEHGNAAKTRFLANVSHELRTPMTAVLGMTELAQETHDDEERTGYLKIVEEAGESLLSLLNDLIDTARIDAGELELVVAPFDPQEVVERVSRMMRFAGREKGLELVVEKPPQRLPMLLGDARRLEQILLNLIGNAIKWTESGSVTAGCQPIAIAAEEARVEFWVSDTGIGIDPSDQQRVFEPFTQLPGASRPSRGGAGLGLSICRRIADAMNARLRLESSPGAGTTVTLAGVFPVAPPEWSAVNEHAPSVLPDPIDVLVVEDTEVNQLLIRRLLQREGHRVEVVGSGEEAVATYGEARFDMVLVDLQLPGIDGATTVNRLNEIDTGLNRPSPPMVCITAHTGPAAAVAEREFDAVVTKPLKREPLIRTLARVLNRSDDDPNRSEPTQCQETTEAPTPRNNIDCELAIAFLGIAEEQLDRLGDALQQRETTEARVLAHRFRGQLAYFDFDPVIEKLARLEDFLETRDAESAQTIRENVLADLSAAIEQLKADVAAAPPIAEPSIP